jgi:hypothetical protein
MECEAAVALPMLVAAGEATSGSAEQQGSRGQKAAPQLISIDKAAGQYDRHGSPIVALLEWAVVGPRAADDVLNLPAGPLRDEVCGGASSDSLLGLQPQRFTNRI